MLWICLGDFNEIAFDNEKLGGGSRNWRRILMNFHGAIKGCELENMGFARPPFTWSNKRTLRD